MGFVPSQSLLCCIFHVILKKYFKPGNNSKKKKKTTTIALESCIKYENLFYINDQPHEYMFSLLVTFGLCVIEWVEFESSKQQNLTMRLQGKY